MAIGVHGFPIYLAKREQMSHKEHCKQNGLSVWLGCLVLIVASSACAERTVNELTFTSPYATVVGAEYRVVGEVDAYGIFENLDNRKTATYITLIPGVGIAGPEVAFKHRIPKGQSIRILSAWRKRNFLSSDVYYLVALQYSDLPGNVPIRIELSRGNEWAGAGLNPNIYERLVK